MRKKTLVHKLSIALICVMLCVLGIACGNKDVSQENNNPNTSTDNSSKKKNEKAKIELNKPFTVTTKEGDYNVTIEGIRFTDDKNQFSEKKAEKVFFLDYSYQNVSQTDDLFVSSSNFKIMDDEGNVLDTYPVSDDNRFPKSVPEGGKCSATETFAMPKVSKNIKILFYDNMFDEAIGEMTISTGL